MYLRELFGYEVTNNKKFAENYSSINQITFILEDLGMISIHTLELTLETNSKRFNDLLSRAYNMAKMYQHRLGHSTKHTSNDVRVDDSLSAHGITVEYHNCEFRKMIKLRVNPSEVLGDNDLKLWKPNKRNTHQLISLLDEHISDYFDSEYDLNDLKLSRIEFTANLNVGKENVSSYIKLLHKIGKVKKFSPKYSREDYASKRIDKKHSFDLEGNTNGIGFTAYDKEADLKKKGKNHKAQKASGILRIEVRLKKRKAVKQALNNYSDESDLTTEDQLLLLVKNCNEIFLTTFTEIVPYGDCYRLKAAEEIVNNSDLKNNQKSKMLSLLRLIPEKKSLYLALKELNMRSTNDLLIWFAKLNLSPITISKRDEADYLQNIYNYLDI